MNDKKGRITSSILRRKENSKMTKYALALLSAVLWLTDGTVSAQTVSRDEAARIAAKYIDRVPVNKLTRGYEAESDAQIEMRNTPYYIFNDADGAGFVIVAGRRELHEVLGYAIDGHVDIHNIPPALAAYLEDYSTAVMSLKMAEKSSSQAQTRSGTSVADGAVEVIGQNHEPIEPLLKTKWNQYAPYNNLAPTLGIGGPRPPIGCVATALAQVMNFNQWPLRGKGSMEYTPSYRQGELNYGVQKVDFSQSAYQWDKTNATSVGKQAGEAVAKIMYDAAVSVRMSFEPLASGAYMDNAVKALKDHFDYTAVMIERENMNTTTYISYLYNELKQGFPVIMSGGKDNGAHAWVCDGVDANGLFSMNWGWGGLSDGYFDLSYLNPYERGAGGGEGDGFYSNQVFIVARPNKNGVTELSPLRPGLEFNGEGTITADSEQTTRSKGLKITLNGLGNFVHRQGVKSRVGVALYRSLEDKDALKTYHFAHANEELLLPYGSQIAFMEQTVTFDAAMPNGTYILYPVTMAYEWEEVWRKTDKPCYLKIKVEGDKVSVIERTDIPHLYLLSAVQGSKDGISGRAASCDLSLYNGSTVSFNGTLNILLKKDGKTEKIATENFFRMMDNDKEIRHIVFTVPQDLKSGRYNMEFSLTYNEAPGGQEGQELMVENQGDSLFLDVQNPAEGPAMHYMATILAHDNQQIADQQMDVKAHPQTDVFVQAVNLSGIDYMGKVEYMLENTQTHERISLGELSYEMKGREDTPSTHHILKVYWSHYDLKKNIPYQLVTRLKRDGRITHTWKSTQSVILYSASDVHSFNVESANVPMSIYTLDGRYMGTTLHGLPKGMYIVNGKKVIKG